MFYLIGEVLIALVQEGRCYTLLVRKGNELSESDLFMDPLA